jgi:hypothetical protein
MRIAAASCVLFVLVVAATWAGVHLKYQRDEAAYVAYLAGADGQSATALSADVPARSIAALPPSAALITEGDLACDWLADRAMRCGALATGSAATTFRRSTSNSPGTVGFPGQARSIAAASQQERGPTYARPPGNCASRARSVETAIRTSNHRARV